MARLLPLLAVLLLAGPALADDDARRAGRLQLEAKDAFEGGELEDALALARRAIDLVPGPETWLARQIQVEALERLGRIRDAVEALDAYLSVDGLFPEHLSWGREARGRLEGKVIVADAEALRLAQRARVQRGLGIGLVVGGGLPTATGVGFLVNYGRLGGDWASYGGWAQAGAAFLAVGLAVEITGAILLATSGRQPVVAVAPVPLEAGFGLALTFSPPARGPSRGPL